MDYKKAQGQIQMTSVPNFFAKVRARGVNILREAQMSYGLDSKRLLYEEELTSSVKVDHNGAMTTIKESSQTKRKGVNILR